MTAMAIKRGTPDNDKIYGTASADEIYGLGGNDLMEGRGGNDRLFGGTGNDGLHGNDGHDVMHGGDGADRLRGGTGNDVLWGQEGDDILRGGGGSDQLGGGFGRNELYGEGGDDVLVRQTGDVDFEMLSDEQLAARGILDGGSGTDTLRFVNTAVGNIEQDGDELPTFVVLTSGTGNAGFIWHGDDDLAYWSTDVAGIERFDLEGNRAVFFGNDHDNTVLGPEGGLRAFTGAGDETFVLRGGENLIVMSSDGILTYGDDVVQGFRAGTGLDRLNFGGSPFVTRTEADGKTLFTIEQSDGTLVGTLTVDAVGLVQDLDGYWM
jgi:Ca2+-binding RTX toxin-like protein